MNILVFDRSEEIREMIQRNLQQIKQSLNIVLAPNIILVTEALKKTQIDLAIIDMDNLNGLFPLYMKTIQSTNPRIVTILLSSFPSKRVFQIFQNKGADFCFDKSNEFDSLINKIDEFLFEHSQMKKVIEKR